MTSERRDSSRRLRREEVEKKIAHYRAERIEWKKGKTKRHYKHTWKKQRRVNAADNSKRREDNCRRDRQQRGFK